MGARRKHHTSGILHTRISRRALLRTGGRTLAGIAGILAAGRAPASWAARELSLLTAVNYAPTSDAKLDELGKRFSKQAGVNVRIDHLQSVQMPASPARERAPVRRKARRGGEWRRVPFMANLQGLPVVWCPASISQRGSESRRTTRGWGPAVRGERS